MVPPTLQKHVCIESTGDIKLPRGVRVKSVCMYMFPVMDLGSFRWPKSPDKTPDGCEYLDERV